MRLRIFLGLLAILVFLGIGVLIYFRQSEYILTSLLWLPALFPGIFLYVLHEQ